MTNEELDKEANLLCEVLTLFDSGEKEFETVAAYSRRLVAQAYEEAAAAQCWSCRDGWPIDDASPAFHRRPPEYGETPKDIVYLCTATEIRALKDSFVQEPVSSS